MRESRFAGTEYSIETKLNEAITQQLVATTDAQFQSQMSGYEAQLQAAQAPPPEGAPAEGILPTEGAEAPPRGDALYADAEGLRIRITSHNGDAVAGPLVGPDGQRIDTSAAAPLLLIGPHRTRARKLYRARFTLVGALHVGPYATGFNSMRAAKAAVQRFFPGQNVAGLSAVPDAEADAFRAYNEGY